MRGKPLNSGFKASRDGITPAGAGKTYRHIPPPHTRTDHPRGCGENPQILPLQAAQEGSPPRMRGKPEYRGRVMCEDGITPADAGKTAANLTYVGEAWDHPRGCGENNRSNFQLSNSRGSPPRMRGKRGKHNSISYSYRITPADAGKTSCAATVTTM